MLTQAITILIILAIVGCILYGRKLIRTEKVDAVFGNPERAKGGTHWVILGSSVILLVWMYYSWDIAKGFYPRSANELCQVAKVNDSLVALRCLRTFVSLDHESGGGCSSRSVIPHRFREN